MAYKDEVYWIERDAIAIATKSNNATSADDAYSGPAGDKVVTVFAVKKANPFVAGQNNSPEIPSEFHEAIAYRAIQKGYEMNPETLQLASYWDGRFSNAVIEGKKTANINKSSKSATIIGDQF
jgi:hypothetical protein